METDIRDKTCKSYHLRAIQLQGPADKGWGWGPRLVSLQLVGEPFPEARSDSFSPGAGIVKSDSDCQATLYFSKPSMKKGDVFASD